MIDRSKIVETMWQALEETQKEKYRLVERVMALWSQTSIAGS